MVAVFNPVNPSMATTSMPWRQAWGRLVSHVLNTALERVWNHVQQADRADPVAHWGQVDDHGDILVSLAGVAPHVLIDPITRTPSKRCSSLSLSSFLCKRMG